MGQYRKKPVVVEAWQWLPPAWGDMPQWLLDAIDAGTCCCHSHGEAATMVVTINTLEGMMTAQPGDWIIQGVKGEIYPCKPEIFATTYETAELERLPDVDTSDIPETGKDWFAKASKVEEMPPGARADAMQPLPPFGPEEPIPEHHYAHPNQRATRFRDEMQQVINSHSRENGSETPDFILAEFMLEVFDAFDKAVSRRSDWYGKSREEVVNLRTAVSLLQGQVEAEGEHTAAGQAEIERLNAENAQLRGELQRVSMAGMTPSMVVGK